MRGSFVLLVLLVFPKSVHADEKKIADVISYGTVITNIVIDTYHSARADDKGTQFKQQVLRTGLVILSSELVKYFVHEERPDGSDNKSFWSEHSGLGCGTTSLKMSDGWQFNIGISMAIATPIGRVVAKKHHWWDTMVGCGVGLGINALVER